MAKTFTAQQMKPLFDKEFFITKIKIEEEKKDNDSDDEWYHNQKLSERKFKIKGLNKLHG